ncbi:MAG TPA: guanylate cyclase [Nitrospirae bacterium]|nr:guanylate cyclase [Nitrospirota bacterium]
MAKSNTSRFQTREEYEKWKADRISGKTSKSQKQTEEENADAVNIHYHLIAYCMQFLAICAFITGAVFLMSLVVHPFGGVASNTYVSAALNVKDTVSSLIGIVVPSNIMSKDITGWIIVVIAFSLGYMFMGQKWSFKTKATLVTMKKDYDSTKGKMKLSDKAAVLSPMTNKLATMNVSNKKEREALLALFAQTKKKIDESSRELTFLAINVVDPDGIKQDEESAIIEHDFLEYKKYVNSKIRAGDTLKSAWTADGIMICFSSIDTAIRTAVEIISGLEGFNKNVKSIKKDFRVCCGINSGAVYYDDSIPMEKMSDRVIDVAGHLQKYALPDSIWMSESAIELLRDSEGFVPVDKVVDGYQVYEWKSGDESFPVNPCAT